MNSGESVTNDQTDFQLLRRDRARNAATNTKVSIDTFV
jgi:hypothetical protein